MTCTRATTRPCRNPERIPGSCSRHLTSEERAYGEGYARGLQVAHFLTYEALPACWTWEPIQVPPGLDESGQRRILRNWQARRCAMCGDGDAWYPATVEDHDHETGAVRGFLCHGCNVHEGMCRESLHGMCRLYRERPATAVLGLTIEYRGRVDD